MNSKQYNNIINHTLVNEPAAQTEDSLTTARAIFNNMGVALPSGDLPEIMEALQTNEYMGWKACTREEAQQAANNGIAAIAIRADQIMILAAEDEDEPVAQTASVMTVSETTDSSNAINFQYYCYNNGTTTIWYIQAIQNTADVDIRTKPEVSDGTYLLAADGTRVKLEGDKPQIIPLLQYEPINADGRDWYRILYNGMVTYAAAECCLRTAMIPPTIEHVRKAEVGTGTFDGLGIRSTPEQLVDDSNLIGRIPDGTIVEIMSEVKQCTNWYAVRAAINDTVTFGWCHSRYLNDNYLAYRMTYSNNLDDTIYSRLNAATNLSKKTACLGAARAMMDAGYAPALIAGMLSNIVAEGTFGKFEDMNASSARLAYLDSSYAGGNFYSDHCNWKNIKNVDLCAVEGLQKWVIDTTGGTFEANGVVVQFGIGLIQWTGDRTTKLLEAYRLKIDPGTERLSDQNLYDAETALLLLELLDPQYRDILTDWVANCESKEYKLLSKEAAYQAGYDLCLEFFAPFGKETKADERGDLASDIYQIMMDT